MTAKRVKTPAEDHDAWREMVQDYIDTGDRGEEPHYVGRDGLFEKVSRTVRIASKGRTDSRTVIVAGAPGAGKTAFMRELAKRRNAPDQPGMAVEVRVSELNPLGLIRKIAEAVDKPVREEKRITHATTGEAGVSVAKAKHERSATTVEPAVAELALRSAEVPWALIKEHYGEHLNADNPLILLCDEAQNMGEDESTTPTRAFLDTLHHGDDGPSPIPLVPVFSGLSNTGDKIIEFGITRPTGGNDTTLNGLSAKEAGEYVLKTLKHLDAETRNSTELSRWRDWFVDDCHGWPKHLRTAMTAVAEAMLEADTSRLRDLDAESIMATAAAFRNDYYKGRLTVGELEDCRSLVSKIVDAAGKAGLDKEPLLDMAADMADAYYAKRPNRTPVSGEQIVGKCIHSGIFQRTESGRFACPIPSMRDYLVSGEDHKVPRPPIPDRGGLRL